jgi:Na+-transporting NADH:ubiquinone oxidoreductase subunit NqrB
MKSFLIDPRNYQVSFLSAFLLYGNWYLGWETDPLKLIVILSVCLSTQALGCYLTRKDFSSLKSAVITSLGLTILLQANSMYTYALAAFLAIACKFVFRMNGKHFFNPANFGIIAVMLLTGDAWISPGQWGASGILFFMVGILGFAVLYSVNRIDIGLFFLVALFALDYSRMIIYQGWTHDVIFHKYTNGSLLLFAFFMITDPVSTPSGYFTRKAFAIIVAVTAFYLQSFMQLHTAPVWALFFISPLTVIFDKLEKAPNFKWIPQLTK